MLEELQSFQAPYQEINQSANRIKRLKLPHRCEIAHAKYKR